MSSDPDNHDAERSNLNAAIAAALDRLDRLFLADGVLLRLTRDILVTRREVRGNDAAAARIARALVDERTANIRAAIGRFAEMVARGREAEAVAALREFTEAVIESLKIGNLADVAGRLTGFAYTTNRLSAPPPVPHVPRHGDDLSDADRRGLIGCGWVAVELSFVATALMALRETLAG